VRGRGGCSATDKVIVHPDQPAHQVVKQRGDGPPMHTPRRTLCPTVASVSTTATAAPAATAQRTRVLAKVYHALERLLWARQHQVGREARPAVRTRRPNKVVHAMLLPGNRRWLVRRWYRPVVACAVRQCHNRAWARHRHRHAPASLRKLSRTACAWGDHACTPAAAPCPARAAAASAAACGSTVPLVSDRDHTPRADRHAGDKHAAAMMT
jgi:hypothetical protein